MNIQKWLKQNTHSLENKTVAITGSTGSLGNELCFYCAKLGAKLVLLNRNQQKTFLQIEQIKNKFPNLQAEFIQVDMQDMQSVKVATSKLNQLSVDYIVLNAGAYRIKKETTSLGYNNIFQINFISPYYIAKQSMLNNPNCKIVAVGSISYKMLKSNFNDNDIDFSSCKKAIKVYGNSKRFLMWSLQQYFLTNNLKNIAIVHPGICYTNITSNFAKCIRWIVKIGMKIIFAKPKKASLSILQGIFKNTQPDFWIGPRIFGIWGKPKQQKLKKVLVEEKNKMFEIAENIYSQMDK